MNTMRLNITLPAELAEKLSAFGNKSRFIAEAVREKMNRDEKMKLEKELRKGYKAEGSQTGPDQDWDVTSGDGID